MSPDPAADDLGGLVAERLGRYVKLARGANAKLAAGTYHADDLVEDWFHWVGMVAQDTTAAVTLAIRAIAPDPPDPPGSPAPGSAPGSADPSGSGTA